MRYRIAALALLAGCHGNHLTMPGRVIGHEHTPAHTMTTLMCSGRPVTCVPIMTYIPDRYALTVHVGTDDVSIEVDQRTFDTTPEGRTVMVGYDTGGCGGYSVLGPAWIGGAR